MVVEAKRSERPMTDSPDPDAYLRRIVDDEALRDYLADRLGPVDTYEVELLGEGHSNETLVVTWGDDDLVIRRPPPGEVASSAHDVLREYRVIDALQDTAVRVPPTVLACDDHSIIGSDFYVMEAVEGDVLRSSVPERFDRDEARTRIGVELVDRLAEIHEVDYEAVGLGELGHPEGFTQRQVERWTKQFDWASEVTESERDVPGVETVTEWLEDNVPEDHPHTLVHGDYKLDNVLFGPGETPEIASVFDWELSTLGDPFTDLGWMLSFWWEEKDPPKPSPTGDLYPDFTRDPGFPSRTELVERYEAQTGWEFTNRRFYRVLGVYKLAALGEMFFRRYLEDNSADPLYPKMREGVPEITDRALRIIEGDEPL
jgi:aminoglycoside phosphotransferase (APT) family kinase protein